MSILTSKKVQIHIIQSTIQFTEHSLEELPLKAGSQAFFI